MSGIADILDRAGIYRLWQAPFAERKLAPLTASGDIGRARRVLDVACGPGTNTGHFRHSDYVGVDINPAYVAAARAHHGRTFIAADFTRFAAQGLGKFDFILLNSFLHHLDDAAAARVLETARTLLADRGHVHVLDLVLPEAVSMARYLAQADRGRFARPAGEWKEMFAQAFNPVRFQEYELGAFGIPLWQMVYFKGEPKG
ncbi:MAG: methyltransferase domain-containing protein [Gemmatimonadaceae bacterium]